MVLESTNLTQDGPGLLSCFTATRANLKKTEIVENRGNGVTSVYKVIECK